MNAGSAEDGLELRQRGQLSLERNHDRPELYDKLGRNASTRAYRWARESRLN
jgi:hypothetical protein